MNPEKKRLDIVRAAMDLFIEYGFDKVSVDDICKKLNISKPTLYKYVPKKELLLAYYYQQESVDCLPKMYDYLDQDRPEVALQSLFFALHRIAMEMGPELYGAYRIYTLSDQNYLSYFSQPQIRLIEECLKRLQQNKCISLPVSPHQLALVLMDLNEGLCLSWASARGSFDLSHQFQDYVDTLLGIHLFPSLETF